MSETVSEFPLTCEWCRKAPATHLAVIDYRPQGKQAADRQEHKICEPCSGQCTLLPPSFVGFWLFELVPVTDGGGSRG